MKIFRHAPLTFWFAALVALTIVVGVASRSSAPLPPPVFGVRADLVTDFRADVAELTLEVESGLADLSWAHAWAEEASALTLRAEGSSSPKMIVGWIEARQAVLEVGSLTELDSQAAVRAIKRLNIAADHLAGLASGISSQSTS